MMLARLVGTAALAAAALTPQHGAPTTARYRIDQTLTQHIDASSAGKGSQSLSFSTSSFLTLTFTDSAGGRSVKLIVDSMTADTSAPIPSAVFDSARGAEFHAFLSPAGKLSDLEAVSASPAAYRVQGFLSDFFPWVKVGVKNGDRWADTSAKTTGDGTDSVTVRRISSYRVVGSEMRDSRKAMRIASEYNSTVAGSQPTPNGPARIEGTGKGTGTYFVSKEGTYMGGEWELQSSLTISGAFSDEPLPITITQSTKVTALP